MIEMVRKARKDEGFTLIELLIVIVILAILAAIVVFAVGTTGSNAAVSACKADAKSLETALEAYKAQNNGTYPAGPASAADTAGWNVLLTSNSTVGTPFLRAQPGTSHYAVWWTTSGSVFVASSAANAGYPTGSSLLDGTANGTANMNFDTNSAACNSYAK